MWKYVLCLLVLALNEIGFARAEERVDLALVLAIDVSLSIDDERFSLQKRGYVNALRDRRVLLSIQSGEHRKVAITIVYWSGRTLQKLAVPWRIVSDQRSLEFLAREYGKMPRPYNYDSTSIAGAIAFSADYLRHMPFQTTRKVIDISGDGKNDARSGYADENITSADLARVRELAFSDGIVINGLPIIVSEADVVEFYRQRVIGGEGSFLIVVNSDADFTEALVQKLVREIEMQIASR